MKNLILLTICFSTYAQAKEIALSFDDAPMGSTRHYESISRTQTLIDKLKKLNVPKVMVFANPCKGKDQTATLQQLELYTKNGHLIGNHTCTHPRLDDVGFDEYTKDIRQADILLKPLLGGIKFFRFPYLNESNNKLLRDQVRQFLKKNSYRNGMVSVDNDDYLFSFKINQAKSQNKKIDYEQVKSLFIAHVMGAADYYDELAKKAIGYSPKHVLLLHEMDATVMFIDALILELRARGWKIIGIDEAFKDKLYLSEPQSTYANNGILPQIVHEKTGEKKGYFVYEQISLELDKILGLK